jgi:hypothetical protein
MDKTGELFSFAKYDVGIWFCSECKGTWQTGSRKYGFELGTKDFCLFCKLEEKAGGEVPKNPLRHDHTSGVLDVHRQASKNGDGTPKPEAGKQG